MYTYIPFLLDLHSNPDIFYQTISHGMFSQDRLTQHLTPPTYWDRWTEHLLPSISAGSPSPTQKKPLTNACFPTERDISADHARWSFFSLLSCPPGPFSTFHGSSKSKNPLICQQICPPPTRSLLSPVKMEAQQADKPKPCGAAAWPPLPPGSTCLPLCLAVSANSPGPHTKQQEPPGHQQVTAKRSNRPHALSLSAPPAHREVIWKAQDSDPPPHSGNQCISWK